MHPSRHRRHRCHVPTATHVQLGETALHKAAYNGHLDVLRVLLGAGADPHVAQLDKNTPLHYAAAQGHAKVAAMLLDAGADVDAMSNNGTPLHDAAHRGHIDAIRVLLGAGASKDLEGSDASLSGHTAELVARHIGHNEAADLIRDWGAAGAAQGDVTDDADIGVGGAHTSVAAGAIAGVVAGAGAGAASGDAGAGEPDRR